MSTNLSTRIAQGLRPGRDVFRSLREEMDDLFGRFSAEVSGEWPAGAVVPSMDLSETDGKIQVRMDLPGVKPEDVVIEIVGDQLRIRGERKEEKEEKGKTYHRVERRSGSFYRATTLPCAVDEEKADAEYSDGVLTVTLAKAAEAKTRHVKIKAK
jgi:HSP20 family protein